MAYKVLCLTVLLAVLEFGTALRCYQCNTSSDPACADPSKISKYSTECSSDDSKTYALRYLSQTLSPDLLKHVDGSPRLCHKLVMKNGAVIRTCLDANPALPNQTCKALETASLASNEISKQIKECSVCDKDHCNAAGSISYSLPLAFMSFVVSYLYSKQ